MLFVSAAVLLWSCKKDEEKIIMNSNVVPTLAAATTSPVVLLQANVAQNALTLNWDSVYYGFADAFAYSLQMSPVSANFSADSIVEVGVTKSAKTKVFAVGELNTALLAIMAAGATKDIAFRLKSDVGNVYSNEIKVKITTFEDWPIPLSYPFLYTPGDYQGWNPGAAVIAKMYSVNSNKKYEGAIFLPKTDGGFKFTPAAVWDNSWGMTGTAVITLTNNGTQTTATGTMAYNGGGDFKFVGPAGYYIFALDADAGTWIAKQSNYSITGDAAQGWGVDVDLEFDAASQTLSKVLPMKVGEWKFRMNHAWDGGDFPSPNLKITEAGTYKILLDVRVPSKPYWKVIKQ